MTSPDIVIVGGGINGCATAYHLAREGHRVVVVERYAPAAMASGWTLAGVRQSGRHPAELRLARTAVQLWPTLDEELGAETGYRQDGNLRLARNEDEVAVIRRLVDDQRHAGLDLTFLPDNEAVRAISTAIAPSVLAASFCPTDGHADPNAAVEAFRAAAERHGAEFRLGEGARSLEVKGDRITGVVTDRIRIDCGACVVAAGIHANDLLTPLGLTVPLRVPMVTVLQTDRLPPLLKPVLGVANANMAARQQVDGRLRVTSGAEAWHGAMEETQTPAGLTPSVNPTVESVWRTIETVTDVLPVFREARIARIWAGLLDLTPDALPVIEAVPEVAGLVIATGFSGHGFGIAPATALVLRDLVLGNAPHLPIDDFRRARFAETEAAGAAALTLHG